MHAAADAGSAFAHGGDVTINTPLAPEEAPFVWFATVLAAVALSCLPLVLVFQNERRRALWRAHHGGRVPWFAGDADSGLALGVLLFLFNCFAAFAYWVCRGGHFFANRISVAVPFYALLVLFAAWSVGALFYSHALPTLMLALCLGVCVAFTVFAFIAQPWVGGVLGVGACLALVGIAAAWMRDSDGGDEHAPMPLAATIDAPPLEI